MEAVSEIEDAFPEKTAIDKSADVAVPSSAVGEGLNDSTATELPSRKPLGRRSYDNIVRQIFYYSCGCLCTYPVDSNPETLSLFLDMVEKKTEIITSDFIPIIELATTDQYPCWGSQHPRVRKNRENNTINAFVAKVMLKPDGSLQWTKDEYTPDSRPLEVERVSQLWNSVLKLKKARDYVAEALE